MAKDHDVGLVTSRRVIKCSPTRDELQRPRAVRAVDQSIGKARLGVLHNLRDGEACDRTVGQYKRDGVAGLQQLQIKKHAGTEIRINVTQDDGGSLLARRRSVDVPIHHVRTRRHLNLAVCLEAESTDVRSNANCWDRQPHRSRMRDDRKGRDLYCRCFYRRLSYNHHGWILRWQ